MGLLSKYMSSSEPKLVSDEYYNDQQKWLAYLKEEDDKRIKAEEEERKKLEAEATATAQLRKDIGLDNAENSEQEFKNKINEIRNNNTTLRDTLFDIFTLNIPKNIQNSQEEMTTKQAYAPTYNSILEDLKKNKDTYVKQIGQNNYDNLVIELNQKYNNTGTNLLEDISTDINIGDLQVRRNSAWNQYLNDGTQRSKEKALELDEQIRKYQLENPNIGERALSNTYQYIPQFGYYAGKNLPAMGVGAVAGAIAGAITKNPNTAWNVGKSAYGLAQIPTGFNASYEQTRGATFGDMISLGIPEDIAREASANSAFWQSLIEEAETTKDIITLFKSPQTKAVTGKVKDFLKNWGVNIISEGTEEGSQSIVSALYEKSALERAGLDSSAYTTESMLNQAWEEAKGGAEIGATMYIAEGIPHIVVNKGTQAIANRTAIQNAPLNSSPIPIKTNEKGQIVTDREQFKQVIEDSYNFDIELARENGEEKLVKELQEGKERAISNFKNIANQTDEYLLKNQNASIQVLTPEQKENYQQKLDVAQEEIRRNVSSLNNITLTVADMVTEYQENVRKFFENIGLNVVYYEATNNENKNIIYNSNGLYIDGNTVYVNRLNRSVKDLVATAWHEGGHEYLAKNPELRASIINDSNPAEVQKYIVDKGTNLTYEKGAEDLFVDKVAEFLSKPEQITKIENALVKPTTLIKQIANNFVYNTTGIEPKNTSLTQYNLSGTSSLNGGELTDEQKQKVLTAVLSNSDMTSKYQDWYNNKVADNRSEDSIRRGLAVRMNTLPNSKEVDAELKKLKDNYNEIRQSASIDTEGHHLSPQQMRKFKNTYARTPNGTLLVVYHTQTDYSTNPFNIFNPPRENSGYRFRGQTVIYTTSSEDVSRSYGGGNSLYIERVKKNRANTIKDGYKMLEKLGHYYSKDFYKIVKKGDIVVVYYDVDKKFDRDSKIVKVFDNFEDYKKNFANWILKEERSDEKFWEYPMYINITNPYIIDAKGKEWNKIVDATDEELEEFEKLRRMFEENAEYFFFESAYARDIFLKIAREIYNADNYDKNKPYAGEYFDKLIDNLKNYDFENKVEDKEFASQLIEYLEKNRTEVKNSLFLGEMYIEPSTAIQEIAGDFASRIKRKFGNHIADSLKKLETNDIVKKALRYNYEHNVARIKETLGKVMALPVAQSQELGNIFRNSWARYNNSKEKFFNNVIEAMKGKEYFDELRDIFKSNPEILKQFYEYAVAYYDEGVYTYSDDTLNRMEQEGTLNKYGYGKISEVKYTGNIRARDMLETFLSDFYYNTTQEEINAINGYDGVIIKNVLDYGGKHDRSTEHPADLFVAFSPNQVDLIDNRNPTNNEDMRYSSSIEEKTPYYFDFKYNELPKEKENLQQYKYIKENVKDIISKFPLSSEYRIDVTESDKHPDALRISLIKDDKEVSIIKILNKQWLQKKDQAPVTVLRLSNYKTLNGLLSALNSKLNSNFKEAIDSTNIVKKAMKEGDNTLAEKIGIKREKAEQRALEREENMNIAQEKFIKDRAEKEQKEYTKGIEKQLKKTETSYTQAVKNLGKKTEGIKLKLGKVEDKFSRYKSKVADSMLRAKDRKKQRAYEMKMSKLRKKLRETIKDFRSSTAFKFLSPEAQENFKETFGSYYLKANGKTELTKHKESIKAMIAGMLLDNPNIVVSQKVKDMLNAESQKTFNEIETLDELTRLYDALKEVINQAKEERTLVGLERSKDALEEQKAFVEAVEEPYKKIDDAEFERSKKILEREASTGGKIINAVSGATEKTVSTIKKLYLTQLETLKTQLTFMAGGNKYSRMLDLYNNLQEGVTRERDVIVNLNRILRPFLNDKQYEEFRKGLRQRSDWFDTGVSVKDERGRERNMRLNAPLLISLAMQSMDEQALAHIGGKVVDVQIDENGRAKTIKKQGGGLTIPNETLLKQNRVKEAYEKGYIVKLNPEQINKIVGKKVDNNGNVTFAKLTKEQNEFVNALHTFFNKTADYINSVSEIMKGYTIANVENYYPIVSNKSYLYLNTGKDNLVSGNPIEDLGLVDNMGFTKDRKDNAFNPIVLERVTDVVTRMTNGVAKYYGYNIALYNNNILLNSRTDDGISALAMLNEIDTTFIENYNLLTGFLSGRERMPSDLFSQFRGKHAEFTLGLNPGVWLKQLLSVPTTIKYFKTSDLISFIGGGAVALEDTMNKYLSSINKDEKGKTLENFLSFLTNDREYRNLGFGLADTSDLKDNKSLFEKINILKGIQRFDMLGFDIVTRMFLYSELSNRGLLGDNLTRLSSEEVETIFQDIGTKLEQFLRETQPDYSQVNRANIQRNKGTIARFITMYSTPSLQMFNNFATSVAELQYAIKTKDKELMKESKYNLIKSGLGILIASTGTVVISRMFNKLLKQADDEDYDFAKELLVATLSPTLILDDVARGIIGLKTYDSQVPELIAYDTLINLGGDIRNLVLGKEESKFKKIENIIKDLGIILGIPTRDLMNIARTVLMLTGSDLYYQVSLRENTNAYKKWLDDNTSEDVKTFYKAYTATRESNLIKNGWKKGERIAGGNEGSKKNAFRKSLEEVLDSKKEVNRYMTILGDYKQ